MQRQEERVTHRLMVWVAGTDTRGNRFQQTARVVNISRLGARLGEIRCLRAPGELLELKCRGRKARFRVVWIDELAGEAGVRCLDAAKNLWGVPLPLSRPPKYEPENLISGGNPLRGRAVETTGGWISGTPTQPWRSPAGGQVQAAALRRGKPGAVPPTPPVPMPERRNREHARHHCSGGVEVRRDSVLGAGERIWGRVTQLSLGGCFVAALQPFAPKTKVTLFLGVQDVQVRAKGLVCRSHAGVGMGIMFTEIDEQNRRGLEDLTTSLAKGGRFSQFA